MRAYLFPSKDEGKGVLEGMIVAVEIVLCTWEALFGRMKLIVVMTSVRCYGGDILQGL